MQTMWVPGVNNLGAYGRWAFAEFQEVFAIQEDECRNRGLLVSWLNPDRP
jgi:hypothetical protein